MVKRSIFVWAALMMAVLLGACSKKESAPPTAEQAKAEKDAAAKAVRENPVYGDQVKAMDKAKAAAAAAGEAAKKTDDASKEPENPITKGY